MYQMAELATYVRSMMFFGGRLYMAPAGNAYVIAENKVSTVSGVHMRSRTSFASIKHCDGRLVYVSQSQSSSHGTIGVVNATHKLAAAVDVDHMARAPSNHATQHFSCLGSALYFSCNKKSAKLCKLELNVTAIRSSVEEVSTSIAPLHFHYWSAGNGSTTGAQSMDSLLFTTSTATEIGAVTMARSGSARVSAVQARHGYDGANFPTADSSPEILGAAPKGGMYVKYKYSDDRMMLGRFAANDSFEPLHSGLLNESRFVAVNYSSIDGSGDGALWFEDADGYSMYFSPQTGSFVTTQLKWKSVAGGVLLGDRIGSADPPGRPISEPVVRLPNGTVIALPNGVSRGYSLKHAGASFSKDGSGDIFVQARRVGRIGGGLHQLFRISVSSGHVTRLPIGLF